MSYDISGSGMMAYISIWKLFIKLLLTEVKYYLGLVDIEINRLYIAEYGCKPDLKNPTTFSEKLLYLNKHYRNPLQTICADKYYAGEYVKACGYEKIVRKFYQVVRNVNDLDFSVLPKRFFIRCNNRSGLNFLIDKEKVNERRVKRIFKIALRHNYYHSYKEWPYKNILPCLICEEVLENSDGSPLVDYKFYCFSGKPIYFMVSYGEYEHDVKNLKYDMEGNVIDHLFKEKSKLDYSKISLPDNLKEMIEVAEVLCKPFPHVRVDLYNIDGKIFFGELTFYSNAGIISIFSKEYDTKLASLIDLDKYKNDFI